jgi:hypothetical protein
MIAGAIIGAMRRRSRKIRIGTGTSARFTSDGASSSAIASPVGKRAAGSFARHRSMTRTSDGGAPRASVASDGACRVMCCASTAWADGAVKGSAPDIA